MNKKFGTDKWREYIPIPVCEEHPEYYGFYEKTWELAFDHIKDVPGMPQNPYMDEAFCATLIWIWDSSFMAMYCKYARDVFPGVETLNNFYQPLYGGENLPIITVPANEPEWLHTVAGEKRQIKIDIVDNPPLFAWAEYENALMSGDAEYIKELLYTHKFLQKHYDWLENLHEPLKLENTLEKTGWMAEKYGYKWEGGCSGMDNTPRGRTGEHAVKQRPNNPDMLWIDAICQQALSAKMIAKLYAVVGDDENEAIWNKKHDEKKDIINKFYWDDKDNFYYDIDCNTHDFYRIMTMASYWTLTSETATEERAEILVKELSNPETLGGFVPCVSLSRSDNDYSRVGKYWRGSVWLPTAYAALKGMAAYGFHKEAHDAASKLLEHMYRTYTDYTPHSIWECYSPEEYKPAMNEDGKTVVRKDFCGWSALGPISIYIEFVLGFYSINAFERKVKWAKPNTLKGKTGIKNLHFGNIITDIVADGNVCNVISDGEYILEINNKSYEIHPGNNSFEIDSYE